ncbi:MAG: YqgE/AlgH family protein [Holosporaceae bacterium]
MDVPRLSSLKGYLLVGAPHVDHAPFQQTVIFLFAHDSSGAMGICINHVFDQTTLDSFVSEADEKIHQQLNPLTLFDGGPIENDRGFIIHTPEYKHQQSVEVGNAFLVTNTAHFMPQETEEPKHFLFALGYTAWQKDALEEEIQHNLWMLIPATHHLLFETTPAQKWPLALHKMGITAPHLIQKAGHA